MNIKLDDIRKFCGESAIFLGKEATSIASGISIDSRTINKGDLFVALKSKYRDGHNYVLNALSKNASAVIVSSEWMRNNSSAKQHGNFIVVPEPIEALQNLAKIFREKSSYKLIGLTGSNGKTTTKEMLCDVLSAKYKTEKTKGNLNNHIGVPLTLLEFKKDTEMAVVEMGANHIGEIDVLSKISKPDIALITNVGYAHVGLFGSIEKIASAKLEIINGLKNGGKLVVNMDSPYLVKLLKNIDCEYITFSAKNKYADVFVEEFSLDEYARPSFFVRGVKFSLGIPGLHSMGNALAAIAVGLTQNIELEDMVDPLSTSKTISGRWTQRDVNGVKIIDDAYNANPTSVDVSLKTLGTLNVKGKRIAVLGDMLELEQYEKEMHSTIGKKSVEYGIDIVYAYGNLSNSICDGVGLSDKTKCLSVPFGETERLLGLLKENIGDGDVVLFKGSRKMELSEIAKKISEYLEEVVERV